MKIDKENHIVDIERKRLGGKEVAHFDISRKLVKGYGSITYAYIVQHGNQSILIWVKGLVITPYRGIEEVRNELDDVFAYMVETADFKE